MKQVLSENKVYILMPFLFVAICVIMPEIYNWTGDLTHFKNWSAYYYKNGLENAYLSATDYPPLFQYILGYYVLLQPSLEAVFTNINQFKYIVLVFDFLGALLVYQWLLDFKFSKDKALFLSCFLLLNAAYLFNTTIWGQVDATYTFFIFAAVYLAYNKKINLTIIFCILAINAKFYVFIFFPLIFLMLLPSLIQKFSWKNLAIWLVSACLLQYALTAIFYHNGHLPLIRHKLFDNALVRKENLSSFAYNLWYWVSPDPLHADSNIAFLGVKKKVWGIVLFVSAYFLMIFPLFIIRIRSLFFNYKVDVTLKHFLLIGTLIPLIFFFFPTQMHERYSHPAIIFAAMNALIYKKYLIYILVSVAYILNLNDVLTFRYWNTGYFFYNPGFIAGIYAVTILILFWEIYKDSIKSRFLSKSSK